MKDDSTVYLSNKLDGLIVNWSIFLDHGIWWYIYWYSTIYIVV
jgi:hypothetical protein